MADRSKYTRATQIFSEGTELVIEDDLVIWLQALNPFEQQDARDAAATARSRLVLALNEHGSDELARYESTLSSMEKAELVDFLVGSKQGEVLLEVTDAIEHDPEWSERMAILEQQDDILAMPESAEERKLLDTYGQEYVAEVTSRVDYELKLLAQRFEKMTDEERRAEFRRVWIERRGGERGIEEYRLKEHFYTARVCEAIKAPDGTFDHSECDHRQRVWVSEEEVRHLPAGLREALDERLRELAMAPKGRSGSGSLQPSSASSATPSAGVGSTPSTRGEASRRHRGTS